MPSRSVTTQWHSAVGVPSGTLSNSQFRVGTPDHARPMRVVDVGVLTVARIGSAVRVRTTAGALVDAAIEVQVHERIRRAVLQLHAAQKYIVVRQLAVAVCELRPLRGSSTLMMFSTFP